MKNTSDHLWDALWLQWFVKIYQSEIVWWCCWRWWCCHSKIVRNPGSLRSCWVEPLVDRTRGATEPRYHRQRHLGQANMAKRQEKWKGESGCFTRKVKYLGVMGVKKEYSFSSLNIGGSLIICSIPPADLHLKKSGKATALLQTPGHNVG